MFKRLTTIKIGAIEFLYKFLLVLFVIMPVCMGLTFWLGVQADAALNIHFLKFVMPFIGSAVGVFFTALLLQAGHKEAAPATAEAPSQPYSDRLVTRHSVTEAEVLQPKPSIPRAGLATTLQGGK